MLYSLLIYVDPSAAPAPDAPVGGDLHDAWTAYTEELQASGLMRGGAALDLPPTATTLRRRDGEALLTDGPFAETKEVLGGFYLIEVDDLDEVLAWAERLPHLDTGSVEVRPVVLGG